MKIDYNLLPFRQSPNYTPGSQTAAFYGRPRTIEFGAGHWWDAPERFPSFAGVIATLMNAARQASAQDVVGDQQVQPLVRREDTSWATGSANPFTYSIEVDPQIIYKWWDGGDKAKADRIFRTLCTRIADLGLQNLPWEPHKKWMNTGCNPIPWGEVMAGAKQVWQEKYGQPAAPVEWVKNLKQIPDQNLIIKRNGAPLRNLANVGQVIKTYDKGTPMLIAGETYVNGYRYLITQYAFLNKTGQGFDEYELELPEAAKPEWQRNLTDTADVKLFVLPAEGTPVYDLNTGKALPDSVIAKGTAVDIAMKTTVGGKTYLISNYSATRAMPNGMLEEALGVPIEPPKEEKPEWLKNLQDITDVTMYTRAEVPLVNLIDGSTIKMIPINTPIEVDKATDWHDQKYFITKWAASKSEPNGILVAHLSDEPIKAPEEPLEPSPEQPDLEKRVSALEATVKAIVDFFGKIFNGFLEAIGKKEK